jgi:hypothetical protein
MKIIFAMILCFWYSKALVCGTSQKNLTYSIVSDANNYVLGIQTPKITNAQACWSGYGGWTADIPGATWIWESYVITSGDPDELATFFNRFYVDGTPIKATLQVAVDNQVWTYINGLDVQCDSVPDTYTKQSQISCNVTKYINPGHNIITIEVNNRGWGCCGVRGYDNPAGLLYKLEIKAVSNSS